MAGIPKTYWDDNPEDRRSGDDFWSWLEHQPLQAWLFYARGANWDSGETILEKMVAHPRCDLGLASFLFWVNEPQYWLGGNEMPPAGTVMREIIDRCNAGGFPAGAVHYDRVEVALNALHAARELANRKTPPPFDVPRPLIQSFEGSNPPIGPFSSEIEKDLAEIFDDVPGHHSMIWGTFYRSDAEYFGRQRRGGNWWYEPALRLPLDPRPMPDMSALEAIESVFGKHRPSLRRTRQEGRRRMREANRVRRMRDPLWQQRRANLRIAVYMAIFAIIAIGGSMIAHRLRTGTW